jgi:hypothetical protein
MTNIGLVYTSDVEFCEYDATLMGGSCAAWGSNGST